MDEMQVLGCFSFLICFPSLSFLLRQLPRSLPGDVKEKGAAIFIQKTRPDFLQEEETLVIGVTLVNPCLDRHFQ